MKVHRLVIAGVVIGSAFVAANLFLDSHSLYGAAVAANPERQIHSDVNAGVARSSPGDLALTNAQAILRSGVDSGVAKRARGLTELNVPLKEIYGALSHSAKSGDAVAACRLAYELQRCDAFNKNQKKLADGLAFMATGRTLTPQQEQNKSKVEREIERDAPICEGFRAEQGVRSADYLLLAARLGHEMSMLQYVAIGTPGLYERPPNADDLATYQSLAPGFMRSALEAGIPQAFVFASAASTREFHGVQLLPNDPISAVAYQIAVARRAPPEHSERLQSQGIQYLVKKYNLTADDLNKANTSADKLAHKIKVSNPDQIAIGAGLFPPDDAKRCY
jgi:hypothetical protein